MHDSDMAASEKTPVVACTLTSADLGAQSARWTQLRTEAGLARVETDDGLRLGFRDEPGVEEELRALVAVENECCAWASWDVLREAGGELVLSVRSTCEGVATLRSMFTG
jgi:hypothetical protein